MAALQQQGQGAASLAGLPEELVSNISVRLGSDDIFNFRLVCKSLEVKSFHEFATEYYSNKCFMITTESLKVLVGIAESERLHRYLRGVWFAPSHFSNRALNCCHGHNCAWKPTVRHMEAYRGYFEDQKNLRKNGGDLKMITKAFKLLPNLIALAFIDNPDRLVGTMDRRGFVKCKRTTNNEPSHIPAYPRDGEYYSFRNHVWKVLMRALVASGITTIEQFNTDLDFLKNPLSVVANLDLDSSTLAGLKTSFANLTMLGLHISSMKLNRQEAEEIDTVRGAQVMTRFSALIPALKDLFLNFSYSPGSADLATGFIPHLDLHKLTKLYLGQMFIDAQNMCHAVSKLTACENLQLVYINIAEGSWTSVLKVLLKLKKLRRLDMKSLMEGDEAVYFVNRPSAEEMAEDPLGTQAGHANGHPLANLHGYDGEEEETGEGGSEDEDSDYEEASTQDEDSEDDSMSDVHSSELGSLPDLEPPEDVTTVAAPPPPPSNPTHDNPYPPSTDSTTKPPSFGQGHQRGTNICLNSAEQISQYIPIFLKEYSVGDDADDDPFGGAMGGPPGGINAFLTSLGAALGTGPPTAVVGNAQAGGAMFTVPAAAGGNGAGTGAGAGAGAGNGAGNGAGTGVGTGTGAGPAGGNAAGAAPQPAGLAFGVGHGTAGVLGPASPFPAASTTATAAGTTATNNDGADTAAAGAEDDEGGT